MYRLLSFVFLFGSVLGSSLSAALIEGHVNFIDAERREYELRVTRSENAEFPVGSVSRFRVGLADSGMKYQGREIRADALKFGKAWNLERIYPLTGTGAKAMSDVNAQLRQITETKSRRKYTRQGDYIPEFGMIDQEGDFLQIRQLRGRPFILNFIFTRCAVPEMCPASTSRMATLQKKAEEAGLDTLNFVSISFDPAFDSPGILKQYAKGYGINLDNFHLLTNTDPKVIDDLLRQFGIITMDEDGTINHTMATLLVDANGRVAFRKEGARWTVDEFLKQAQKLYR